MVKDKDKKQQDKKCKLDIHLNQLADNFHSALVYKSADTLKLIDRQRQLHEETDQAFIKSITKIIKNRQNQYVKLLKQGKAALTIKQCEQLHYRAKIHGKANTINQNSHIDYKDLNQLDKCKCGCKKGKGKYISFCINQQKLKVLGPGVLLQLLFQKAAAVVVLSVIVIYCIFAVSTNYIGGQAKISQGCQQQIYCRFKQQSSDQNKDFNTSFQTIQNWLGVVFCIFWVLSLRIIRYVGKQKNRVIDSKLNSAADCAIKVENLPRGTYQQQQLIGYLQGVWQKKLQKYFSQKNQVSKNLTQLNIIQNKKYKLKFKSIQIIYNMEFARKMINQIIELIQRIDYLWIKDDIDGIDRILVHKKHQYKETKRKLIQNYELLEDLRKRFLNSRQFRKLISTKCCLIQFESQKKRKAVLNFIGEQKVGFFKRVCLRMKNLFNSNTRTTLFHDKVLRIERAPEPSDILWENCEKPQSNLRKFGIFLVTVVVMTIAFGIIFGLTYIQQDVKLNSTKYNTAIQTVVNNFIGIVLQIINTILWQVTSFLLTYEYNHTETQKIISLMTRILILNSINVIALPIFSNYIVYGRGGIYGNDGLAGIVFDYHTSAIIAAIKGLFDITAIIKTIGTAIRWTRHKIIWFLITDTVNIDFKKGDPNVNKFYQGIEYDIAQNYMFIIIAILHASFFCHLQPFIVIILFVMIIVFYLVNRTKLLYLCKMPGLTQYLVFDTAIWMLGLVPIFYSVGTISISYIQNQNNQNYPFQAQVLIPTIICGAIGIFGLTNPAGILNKIIFWLTNKIIGNIDDPQQNQIDQDDFTEDSEVSQLQFMDQEIKNKGKQKQNNSTRLQSYYDQSNLLILLGFQKVLKNQKLIQIRPQLKNYCQSFFIKQYETRYFQQNLPLKQKIIKQQNNQTQWYFLNQINTIKIKPKTTLRQDNFGESPQSSVH